MKNANNYMRAATLIVNMGIFVLLPINSYANPDEPHGDTGTNLQLGTEQQQIFQKIMDDNAITLQNIREGLNARRAQLKNALQATVPDSAQIEQLSAEIGQLRGKDLANRVVVRAKLIKEGLPADTLFPMNKKLVKNNKKSMLPNEEFTRKINEKLPLEQQTAARKILDANFETRKTLRKAIEEKHGELERAMRSENPDPEQIVAISTELGLLRGKELANRVELRSRLAEAGLPKNVFDRPNKGKREAKKVHKKRAGAKYERSSN